MVIGLDEKVCVQFLRYSEIESMREGIRVIGFLFCWQDENKQKNEKNMKEA